MRSDEFWECPGMVLAGFWESLEKIPVEVLKSSWTVFITISERLSEGSGTFLEKFLGKCWEGF